MMFLTVITEEHSTTKWNTKHSSWKGCPFEVLGTFLLNQIFKRLWSYRYGKSEKLCPKCNLKKMLGLQIFGPNFWDLLIKFSQKDISLKITFVWDVRLVVCQNPTDVLEVSSASIFTVSSRTRNLTEVLLLDLSCCNPTTPFWLQRDML